MARNGSGVMTVPNSFVSGGTITASSHNQNYSDIASELTNSVAADGQTTMTAPLKHSNGTVAAPSITFGSDLDTGFYRKAANSVSLSLGGADAVTFSSANAAFSCGASFSGPVGITGEFIASATATFVLTASFSQKPVVPAKSFAISKIADGTANRLYGTDGSGVAAEITAGTGISISASSISASIIMPRGYIDGCIMSNGTDATNDINIGAGVCRDSTNAANIICAAMAGKQLDANWAPGAAAGMRNSAAGIANGTYHIYAIAKADGTQDYYATPGVAGTDPDASAAISAVITAVQAESGGGSYLYARRIGSILRESATIIPFTQVGEEFLRTTPLLSTSTAPTATAALVALGVPLGLKVIAKINAVVTVGAAALDTIISSPDQTDSAPSTTAAPGANLGGQSQSSATVRHDGGFEVRTDASAQVRWRSSATASNGIMVTVGWRDRRGTNA